LGIQVVVKFLEVSIHVFETQTQGLDTKPLPKVDFAQKPRVLTLNPDAALHFDTSLPAMRV